MISNFSFIHPTNQKFSTKFGEQLLIRRKNEGSHDLLFKVIEMFKRTSVGIYEFSLNDKKIIYHQDDRIWNETGTEIEIFIHKPQRIRRNEKFGYRWHTLYKIENHRNDQLAVLTSSGFINQTISRLLASTWNESILLGTTYFEILDLKSRKQKTNPIKISASEFEFAMYWTRDDKFIIISGTSRNLDSYSFLGVIEIDKPADFIKIKPSLISCFKDLLS